MMVANGIVVDMKALSPGASIAVVRSGPIWIMNRFEITSAQRKSGLSTVRVD